jgi:hypothetical protein
VASQSDEKDMEMTGSSDPELAYRLHLFLGNNIQCNYISDWMKINLPQMAELRNQINTHENVIIPTRIASNLLYFFKQKL